MIRDQIKLIRFNCDIRFLTQPSAQCAKKFPPSNMELRHPFRPDASLSISAFLIVHDNALHSSYPRHVLVSTNNGPSTHGDSLGLALTLIRPDNSTVTIILLQVL